MTKEQERAALAKIEKIINEAGPESYIGMTFEGMIALCEDNISNDWGSNPIKDLDTARERNEENTRMIARLETACREHMQETEDADGLYQKERELSFEYLAKLNETAAKLDTANNTVKALQAEIVTLKAKLYDLMTQ